MFLHALPCVRDYVEFGFRVIAAELIWFALDSCVSYLQILGVKSGVIESVARGGGGVLLSFRMEY